MNKSNIIGVTLTMILIFSLPRTVISYLGNCSISYYMCSSDVYECNFCLPKKMPGQLEEVERKHATFGMGCFWAGDSLFGALPGVIRTCVGYSGGTKEAPTYRNM